MRKRETGNEPRTIRSHDGIWIFIVQEPLRVDDAHECGPLLMARTPAGRIIDVYLPLGVDPDQVPDEELLGRARRVVERVLP